MALKMYSFATNGQMISNPTIIVDKCYSAIITCFFLQQIAN